MKNLSQALALEKNKIAGPNPWLILLDVQLRDEQNTTLYLVKNNANIIFNNHEYIALNFELDAAKESSKGEIPSITLKISNVTRILQAYLEELNGAIGATVTLRVVNAGHLRTAVDEHPANYEVAKEEITGVWADYSELEMTFDVISSSSDAYWVTFTLGAPNPLRSRFPQKRYIANYCGWKFNSPDWRTTEDKRGLECSYQGTAKDADGYWVDGNGERISCKRTLEDCKDKVNSPRFGGYAGLNNNGVRFGI